MCTPDRGEWPVQRAGGQSSAPGCGAGRAQGSTEPRPRGGRPEAVKLGPRAAGQGRPKLLRSLPKRTAGVWGRRVRGLDPRELSLPVRADVSESVETGQVTTTCRVTRTAQDFGNREESRDTASRKEQFSSNQAPQKSPLAAWLLGSSAL